MLLFHHNFFSNFSIPANLFLTNRYTARIQNKTAAKWIKIILCACLKKKYLFYVQYKYIILKLV